MMLSEAPGRFIADEATLDEELGAIEIAIAAEEEAPEIDEARQRLLAERRTGIGGSDAAALVGLDPYRNAYSVYLEKRGELEPEDLTNVGAVRWGRILEDPVAREYAVSAKRRIARVNSVLRHPYLPFAIAHIDRRIIGERRGLEVKTAGYWMGQGDAWGEPGTDQIPMQYLCQVQWYMGVTGWPIWDVAALIGGSDFRAYTVQRDEDLIAELFARAAALWGCVLTGEIPTASATQAEALEKWPTSTPTRVEATREIAQALIDFKNLKAQESASESALKALYPKIVDHMREADTLTWAGADIATWKTQSTGVRFDAKSHEADHPECHARYVREGSTRVLRPKKVEIVL